VKIRPITFRAACAFVDRLHRHHKKPQGHKFSLGLEVGGELIGVVIVGRPVSRKSDDGLTAEVTRLCTDGTPNAASKLYGAARRVCGAMGYEKVLTFTMDSEPGTSLFAAGWIQDGVTGGKSWNVATRPRTDKHELGPRKRWSTLTSKTAAPHLSPECRDAIAGMAGVVANEEAQR
jgi:hypothetical protein